MKFRPCIDIHNGKVKQIVGGSLLDKGDYAQDNFVSEKDGDFYAKLYKDASEISKQKAPSTFSENIAVAREGGEAAGIARKAVEARTGVPVITSKNAAQLNQVVASVLENSITETPDPSKKQ